jgi:hypothetical protein
MLSREEERSLKRAMVTFALSLGLVIAAGFYRAWKAGVL